MQPIACHFAIKKNQWKYIRLLLFMFYPQSQLSATLLNNLVLHRNGNIFECKECSRVSGALSWKELLRATVGNVINVAFIWFFFKNYIAIGTPEGSLQLFKNNTIQQKLGISIKQMRFHKGRCAVHLSVLFKNKQHRFVLFPFVLWVMKIWLMIVSQASYALKLPFPGYLQCKILFILFS